MKKRLLFFLVTLTALLCLFALTASAETYTGYCGGEGDGTNLSWTLDTATGKLTITGEGAMADYAYKESPFCNYYSYIKNVVIGDSVTTIGNYAFCKCYALQSIEIPDNVTTIGNYAFYYCTALQSIEIPDSVTAIGTYAFVYCYALQSIEIPDSVTTIGDTAFYYCRALRSIAVDENNPYYSSLDGVLFNKAQTTLVCHPAGKKDTSYTVPDGVTTIGNSAFFYNCNVLQSVVIPDSVTIIGKYAFYSCSALQSIDIPDSVTTIGNSAFEYCDALQSVVIGDGVTTIGDRAFFSCGALQTVEIGDGVTTIGNLAFYNCDVLQSVVIPDSVTIIGNSAFYKCSALQSIEIPDSVTTIEYGAFSECSALQTVEIGDNVTTIGNYAFEHCDALQTVEIGDGVTTIGDRAFRNCSALQSAVIGDSVTTIGTSAFYGTGLKKVYYHGTKDEWQSISIASGNDPLSVAATIYYMVGKCGNNITWDLTIRTGELLITGEGTMTDYPASSSPFYWYRSYIKSVAISDGVTTIGDYAFYNCKPLQSIEIPDSVTTIGNSAFENCDALQSVVIGDSVTTIGNSAFKYCDALQSIEIPDSVTTIGNSAFENCDALQSVVIGDSVMTIGSYAFYKCSALKSITVDENNPYYSSLDGVLFNKAQTTLVCHPAGKKDTSYTVPDGVTTIGNSAFYSCSALQSIDIPDSVMTIGAYAFSGCSALQSIVIGDSVTTIGNSAFEYCDVLQSVVIPDSVTIIGKSAFYKCSALQSIEIPDSVTTIEYGAFSGCSALQSIVIGDSVMTIGNSAFSGCSALQTVEIGNSVTTIGYCAFYDCSALQSIVLPASVTTIGDYAFTCEEDDGGGGNDTEIASLSLDTGIATYDLAPASESVVLTAASASGLESAYFEGNAPQIGYETFPADVILYYDPNTTGWTDSEAYDAAAGTWNGYKLVSNAPVCVDDDKDTYCDDCGAQLVVIEKVAVAGSNMNLGNEVQVNFIVNNLPAGGVYTAYIHQQTEDGVVTHEVPMSQWTAFNASRTRISVRVRAMEMADTLSLEIKDADGYVRNTDYTTSVRDYAAKALVSASSTDAMKTLVVDMLGYGAAAQTNFGYKADDLANADLTEEQKVLASADVECVNSQVKGTNNLGANLALDDCILLNLFFKGFTGRDLNSIYAKVTFTNWKGEEKEVIIPGTEFEMYRTSDQYKVKIDDIVLADASCLVTVELYDGDAAEPFAYGSDSVESYANRGASTASAPLYNAIMKFAASARAYLLSRQ